MTKKDKEVKYALLPDGLPRNVSNDRCARMHALHMNAPSFSHNIRFAPMQVQK
jgi:hypothetical protein